MNDLTFGSEWYWAKSVRILKRSKVFAASQLFRHFDIIRNESRLASELMKFHSVAEPDSCCEHYGVYDQRTHSSYQSFSET